jgi:hypothetical protein
MEKAKVGETLIRGEYRGHSCFKNDKGQLACIKHGTQIHIENIKMDRGVAQWLKTKWDGQSMTVTMIDASRKDYGRRYAADCVTLPDGFVLRIDNIAEGVHAAIPRKVRKDKGVAKPRNLFKLMGLDQLRAEPMARIQIIDPNPKPDDDQKNPVNPDSEPAKEPEPVREPSDPTPAAA